MIGLMPHIIRRDRPTGVAMRTYFYDNYIGCMSASARSSGILSSKTGRSSALTNNFSDTVLTYNPSARPTLESDGSTILWLGGRSNATQPVPTWGTVNSSGYTVNSLFANASWGGGACSAAWSWTPLRPHQITTMSANYSVGQKVTMFCILPGRWTFGTPVLAQAAAQAVALTDAEMLIFTAGKTTDNSSWATSVDGSSEFVGRNNTNWYGGPECGLIRRAGGGTVTLSPLFGDTLISTVKLTPIAA